jgi:hypothetical protein
MARILKVNVSQLEGRNLLNDQESTILPNGTIIAYQDPNSNKYKLGIHDGVNVLPDFLFSDSDVLEKSGIDTNLKADGVVSIKSNLDSVNDSHTWEFMSDGTTYFPYNTSDAENLVTYLSTANNVSNVNLEVEATKDVYLVADSRGTPSKWKFDTAGNITLPSGGDILNSAGGSLIGLRKVDIPDSSVGASGDKAGDIAIDDTHVYVATEDFVDSGYETTFSGTYSGFYPSIVKGSVPQPQAGWIFTHNGTEYTLTENATEGNPGEWGLSIFPESISVSNGTAVTIGPPPSGEIWKKVELKEFDSVEESVTKLTSSWNVVPGTFNYTFQVPVNGVYQLWVRGNIPNGIINYIATVHISNSNVPVIGTQYAWNYTGAGNPLLFTSIPDQIIGTAGAISTANPGVGTTTNTFVFGIANSTAENVTVQYGYVKLS